MKQRHYEFVILVSPGITDDEAKTGKDAAGALISSYCDAITAEGGTIHRNEFWPKRSLAYPIKEHKLAYYFLLNIECTPKQKEDLERKLTLNDAAILRFLCLKVDKAITEPSAMMTNEDARDSRKDARRGRGPRDDRAPRPSKPTEESAAESTSETKEGAE